MERKIPIHFDVLFIENGLHATNDPELFTGKVRTFYKGENRNGSYMTDEFAQKLALSAYMKPIFGTYSYTKGDFLSHEGPEMAKAYGFDLPNSLVWEDHLDKDGVVRTYATYDFILWAEYWSEAKTIFGKSQSMEIDPKTIKGEWKTMDDSLFEVFVYSEGVLAGLCVLGDDCEPCFEGAAFFSTDDQSYAKFQKSIRNYFQHGGKDAMNIKVAGVEAAQFDKIFAVCNPNFTEEGNFELSEIPFEFGENTFSTVSCLGPVVNKYSYSIGENEEVVVEKVEEINYFTKLSEVSAENETKLNEQIEQYNSLNEKFEQLQNDKAALDEELATLREQFETLQNDFNAQAAALAEKDQKIAAQDNTIAAYENKEKDALIEKFAAVLPASTMEQFNEKRAEMSIDELNTALSLEYTSFSLNSQSSNIRFPEPKPEEPKSKLISILNAYKK